MNIILGTPWWVSLIFFYLLYVGLAARRPHIVWIPKFFIIPAILLSLKIQELYSVKSSILLIYMLCALLGYFLGRRHVTREKFEVIKSSMSVKLQGSYKTIIILMCFFSLKYLFGFLKSEMPNLFSEYKNIELGVSGIFTWYFLGRALGYWREYKK